MQVRPYALKQTSVLLGRFAFRARRAIKSRDSETFEELDAAARRFAQAMRVFDGCFPARQSRKIRARLGKILRLTGEIHDQNIALQLCEQAGLAKRARVVAVLLEERKQTEQALVRRLTRLAAGEFSRKWRKKLSLQTNSSPKATPKEAPP